MRRRAKAAKAQAGKKPGFTILILNLQQSPALVAKYRKNPKAVEAEYGLTAAQARALKSGSIAQINAKIGAEGSLFRIRPWMGTIHFG